MKSSDRIPFSLRLPFAAFACLVFSGCATHHKTVVVAPLPRDVPGTTLSSDGIESVRYAENIKAYPVNRYVDPANRGLMHEGHTIYRVETSPRWNLRPNQPVAVPLGPTVAAVHGNPAAHPGPLPGELAAELARQKEATRTVIAQGERLGGSIDRLQGALNQTATMAQEQQRMQADLTRTQGRIEQLEKERQERVSSGGTADSPAAPPPPLPKATPNGQKPDSFESP